MSIGNNIRNIRKEKGMTLQQIADIMGCSPQLISQYESGKRQPKLETKKKIADALNCQVSDIDESLYINRRIPYFSNALEELRTERNLTQKELARELHVKEQNIVNWENGKREPYFHIIERIADYFGTSLLYLYYGNKKHKKGIDNNDKEAIAQEKAIKSAPRFFSKKNIDYPISNEPFLGKAPNFTCASRSNAQTEAYVLFHSLLSEDWIMTQEQEVVAVQLRDILNTYTELNEIGRKTAVKRIEELRYSEITTDTQLDDIYFNRIKKKINDGEKLTSDEIEWWHNYLDKSVKTIGAIFESLFSMLNEEGRRKAHTQINRAIDQIELLTKIPEYQKKPNDPPQD